MSREVQVIKNEEKIMLDLPLYRKTKHDMGDISYLCITEDERAILIEKNLNSFNIDYGFAHDYQNPLEFELESSAAEFDAVLCDSLPHLNQSNTPATMLSAVNVNKELLAELMDGFFTDHGRSCHGIAHWLRVMKNGLTIAKHNPEVDPKVIIWFALFHDSKRTHDGQCPVHSGEGAENAKAHLGELNLNKKQTEQLLAACAGHTAETHTDDATVAACWDSDRLDLYRVGKVTDAKFLNSDVAKSLISWGIDRAGEEKWESDLAGVLGLEEPREALL